MTDAHPSLSPAARLQCLYGFFSRKCIVLVLRICFTIYRVYEPYYAHLVLEDLQIERHTAVLQDAFKDKPALSDGCLLLKVCASPEGRDYVILGKGRTAALWGSVLLFVWAKNIR